MTPRRGEFLSARDRRAISLGGRLLLPVAVYLLGVKPYVRSVRDAKDALDRERGLLAREQAVLSAAAQVPRAIAEARAILGREGARLYSSRDVMDASGLLARDVSAAFGHDGIALQQIEPRDATGLADGVRELTVDVRGEGDLEGIMGGLAALEAASHLYRVTRLGIEGGPANAATSAEGLRITATIHAYSLAPDDSLPTGTAGPTASPRR